MELLLRKLRSCAYCRSSWGDIDLFCTSCWRELQRNICYQEYKLEGAPFDVTVLWEWNNTSPLLKTFAHAQKGIYLNGARLQIINQFLMLLQGDVPQTIYYVIPAHKKRDHASELARIFAEKLGAQLQEIRIESVEQYKRKKKYERIQIRKVLSAKPHPARDDQKVWFVDDIVTTGTTAKAVWDFLDKPQYFRVIALIRRPL